MKDLLIAALIWVVAVLVIGDVEHLVGLFVQTDALPSVLFGIGMSHAGVITALTWYRARHA
jgi:hypothetical protein